jgi:hypothetical protein
MNDDEIVTILRQDGRRLEPVGVTELLDRPTVACRRVRSLPISSAHSRRSHCVSFWKPAAGVGLVAVR